MGDYVSQIVYKPTDNRTKALNELLNSGILNKVSANIANRLWETVMK